MWRKLQSYWWWDYAVAFFVVNAMGVVCCGGSVSVYLLAAWASVTIIQTWLAAVVGFNLMFVFMLLWLLWLITPRPRALTPRPTRLGWLNLIASVVVVLVLILFVYLVG